MISILRECENLIILIERSTVFFSIGLQTYSMVERKKVFFIFLQNLFSLTCEMRVKIENIEFERLKDQYGFSRFSPSLNRFSIERELDDLAAVWVGRNAKCSQQQKFIFHFSKFHDIPNLIRLCVTTADNKLFEGSYNTCSVYKF